MKGYITYSLVLSLLAGIFLGFLGDMYAADDNLARIADNTRFNNAYHFVKMEMPDKAAPLLAEYIEVYINGIHRKEALMALGDIYFDSFEFEKARNCYMMLFEESSNTEEGVEAYYRCALCYVKMGMSDKAEKVLSDIVDNYSQYGAAEKARLQRDIESILTDQPSVRDGGDTPDPAPGEEALP